MPTLTVTRNSEGQIDGASEKDQRAYARFVKRMRGLTDRDSLVVKWFEPRSPRFHKYHFAILGAVFKSQEQFDDEEALRKWIEVGAGHCKFVPGPKGKMVALPMSINYEALDDVEFGELHKKVRLFLRSQHATRFLFPHLDDMQGLEMIEAVLSEFEG